MQITRSTTRTVGILGGMGPAAGADFARLFVQACGEHMCEKGIAVSDQAFPEHWLALHAVPGSTNISLVDPAALLARALAQRAYGL